MRLFKVSGISFGDRGQNANGWTPPVEVDSAETLNKVDLIAIKEGA